MVSITNKFIRVSEMDWVYKEELKPKLNTTDKIL